MITGSEGVSLRFPQLFLSQHRLNTKQIRKKTSINLPKRNKTKISSI